MKRNYSLIKKVFVSMFAVFAVSIFLNAQITHAITIDTSTPIVRDSILVAPTNGCIIHSFKATPSVISQNGSSTLTWSTTNCGNIRISGGNFLNTLQVGSSVSTGQVSTTTQYILTATGPNNSKATAYETVTVTNSVASTCEVTSFYASSSAVGYGQSTTLYYTTTGCTTVSIYPTIGVLSATSGSVNTGQIFQTTRFTISATGSNGTTSAGQFTVSLTNSNPVNPSFCSINSFYSSPSTVTNGQSAVLYWQTTGCSSLRISGGAFNNYSQLPAQGSIPTGSINSTTTFTLYGFGSNSVSRATTITVTGGSYPVVYACSDGVDNDGDGLIDWPNDPGCFSQYGNDETNTGTASGVVTLTPSNVSSGFARLNGVVTGATGPVNVYFEHGRTISLGQTTALQYVQPSGAMTFFDSINTQANTTYFYRAVLQSNGMIQRGSIMSFTSGAISNSAPIYVNNGPSYSTKNTVVSTPVSDLLVSVTNKKEKVFPRETIDYTITYENQSGKRLREGKLVFVLPQGVTLIQATQGILISPSTIEINLGEIPVGKKETIFIQAVVQDSITTNETLVTTATLYYTLPNNERDSAVGYVLNQSGSASGFGGMAMGSGFFPTTVLGWFLTIIVILVIILIIRRIVKSREVHR